MAKSPSAGALLERPARSGAKPRHPLKREGTRTMLPRLPIRILFCSDDAQSSPPTITNALSHGYSSDLPTYPYHHELILHESSKISGSARLACMSTHRPTPSGSASMLTDITVPLVLQTKRGRSGFESWLERWSIPFFFPTEMGRISHALDWLDLHFCTMLMEREKHTSQAGLEFELSTFPMNVCKRRTTLTKPYTSHACLCKQAK